METQSEKMHSVLMRIVGWNVCYLFSKEKEYDKFEKMFKDTLFEEIPFDNLNYHDLELNVNKHLVIGLKFYFSPLFLQKHFQLYGYINKRPYLEGEVVFDNSNLFHILGYEFVIKNNPRGNFVYCRYCPSDKIEIDPGNYPVLNNSILKRRNFEEEFNNFYYSSSLVHI